MEGRPPPLERQYDRGYRFLFTIFGAFSGLVFGFQLLVAHVSPMAGGGEAAGFVLCLAILSAVASAVIGAGLAYWVGRRVDVWVCGRLRRRRSVPGPQ